MTGGSLSHPARAAIAIAAGLALADASIVTLGLPSILLQLDSTVEGVALVLGVYTAVLAAALPVATRLADRTGPARLAARGIALFAAASFACGLVSSMPPLLVLRGFQAAGGAAVLVAAFELLAAGSPGPGRRAWVAASIFGAAVGPALGGALTEAFDWRAIFLVQAPLLLPGLVIAFRRSAGEPAPEPAPAASPLPPRPTVALALLSAALTAVIFLVVLLLVSGWSVEPLRAALAVSVLPLAALAASRLGGDPRRLAASGCLMVAGGIGCLALLPAASAWWTVAPQLLAGAGMGMALPALTEELIGERNRREAARLLVVRNLGIVVALAVLAPTISAGLDSSIASAREQGTAAMLDSSLPPETKIDLAPELLSGVKTDDPRGELADSVAEARGGLEGEEAIELDSLGKTLDEVITDAVRTAFRPAFVITAVLALGAAAALLSSRPAAGARRLAPAVAAGALAAVAVCGVYAVAFSRSDTEHVELADPCKERALPDAGGIGGALQDLTLDGLDRAACKFGSGREELLLALFDDELRRKFEDEHGVDPRSPLELGPAVLGF